MISRIIVILLFSLFSTSVLAYSKPGIKNSYVIKQCRFGCFDKIQAAGNLELQINAGCYGHTVKVCGKLNDVSALRFCVRGSTLYIGGLGACRSGCCVKVQVNLSCLKQLVYTQGSANIHVHACSNYPLSLDIQGSPNIDIQGNILPGRFCIGGQTQFSAYWMNGCDFYVKASDCSRVCLGGRVGTFAADALQSAWVDARYLQSERAFVKSYNSARVDLRACCALNMFASENSAIYYYKTPYFQAPFMQGAGKVVPMTHICVPVCTDCDWSCCKNGWH